ncbi:hypothetical protein BDA96_10G329600 [Sorghum bicolor]|jgi:hypothetical protein|uniref:Uncharacterized protein n=2 Tax=Sorghum bicolor TaxID=4558 RepID=A0A921Q6V0_SORBI|nr:hypothetical protein SORBI_3010G255200 [Sorghum bicolor]KAG0516046.1 hypothetical protein BDA96_10G329600 [Sorghum bicolor]
MITKETVPDSFIDILTKRRPFKKFPPMTDEYYNLLSKYDPKLRDRCLMDTARRNCCVDLHYDVLRQHAEKGFAEVGVDFTGGVKKIFILPESIN